MTVDDYSVCKFTILQLYIRTEDDQASFHYDNNRLEVVYHALVFGIGVDMNSLQDVIAKLHKDM